MENKKTIFLICIISILVLSSVVIAYTTSEVESTDKYYYIKEFDGTILKSINKNEK